MTTNEDTDMIDAASIPADDDEVDKNTTESGYQRNKDGRMDRSSSKGKGKAHSISPEASIGARYRSSRVSQSNMDMDMDTEDNSGSDHSRDENSQEEGSDGDGSVDQDEDVLQFYPVATVDPPVQEIRVDEDGEAEVRPEDAGEEGLGWEEGVGN